MRDDEIINFVKWVIRKKLWITKGRSNFGIRPHKLYKNLLKEFKILKQQ